MGVAAHLGIRLDEYDARIETFIPDYREMLDVAADTAALSLRRTRKTILLDLGIGSGALAGRCLERSRRTRVIGIDVDQGMLAMAERRLRRRLTPVVGALEQSDFPRCDAVTASFSLHHLRSKATKARVYRRCRAALRPGGRFVIVDRYLSPDLAVAARDRAAWRAHLMRAYSRRRADAFLDAWSKEDHYLRLDVELEMIRAAGFTVDVIWRRGGFGVVAALGL
jgi:SAM-dependent methyltransferase